MPQHQMTNEELIQALSPRAESPSVKHLDTILVMLTTDIKEIKDSIKANQQDTREEFRRVNDKMDALNRQYAGETRDFAVLLKEVETRQHEGATFAGRIAGAIAGFVTAVVVSLIAVGVKEWLEGARQVS